MASSPSEQLELMMCLEMLYDVLHLFSTVSDAFVHAPWTLKRLRSLGAGRILPSFVVMCFRLPSLATAPVPKRWRMLQLELEDV